MPLTIVHNDITRMRVDAIVNAANPALQRGGGVCGAIFEAAGESELQEACQAIGGCEVGQAVITPGFRLPATYIIHTPGPIWHGGDRKEAILLRECYLQSLLLARVYGCQSIAFPLISTGIYGYPTQEALHIASAAIQDVLKDHDLNVFLVLLDKSAVELGEPLRGGVEAFIHRHYVVPPPRRSRLQESMSETLYGDAPSGNEPASRNELRRARLEDLMGSLDPTFSEALFGFIDAKRITDVDVYKRANIDRKLFSKIRSNSAYTPSKKTAIALALALELDVDETRELLGRAGYALSRSQKFDVIIEYFILQGDYDIFKINEVLFSYDQPLLGS